MKAQDDKKLQIRNSTADFLVFTKQSETDGIEVRVHGESVWLTQKSMAQLFDCSTDNIGLHLKNIFQSGELAEKSVTEESSATASDGKSYKMKFYNLDAIISVGYRINSVRATQFRQWATQVLKTFAIQGYVLDKKRLENGHIFNCGGLFGNGSYDERIFCGSAKQIALCNSRTHGCRTDYGTRRPCQRTHGANDLEECASRQNRQSRREHSEKLSVSK